MLLFTSTSTVADLHSFVVTGQKPGAGAVPEKEVEIDVAAVVPAQTSPAGPEAEVPVETSPTEPEAVVPVQPPATTETNTVVPPVSEK